MVDDSQTTTEDAPTEATESAEEQQVSDPQPEPKKSAQKGKKKRQEGHVHFPSSTLADVARVEGDDSPTRKAVAEAQK